MKNKNRIRAVVDLTMCVLLPLMMAYSLIGEELHEWLGMGMLLAFILHHILNLLWFKHLFKGRYTPVRALYAAVDILLTIFMITQPISGIVMSKHIFLFLNFHEAAAARLIHLLGAYWGFLLMCVHLGLHLDMLAGKIFRGGRIPGIARVIAGVIGVYGIYALFKRQIPSYLFLQTQFVFFDFGEAVGLFLLDYLTIMIMSAAIGHGCVKLARRMPWDVRKEKLDG